MRWRLVSTLFSVGCVLDQAPAAGPGAEGLRGSATPRWEHIAPRLTAWCGGCHASLEVSRDGDCVSGICFTDDPCLLASAGCCTMDDPFLTCEERDEREGPGARGPFTVAQCGLLRTEYALDLAASGMAGTGGGAGAAVGFLKMGGFDQIDEVGLNALRTWVHSGHPLPAHCNATPPLPLSPP